MRRIAGFAIALALFALACDGETPRSYNLALPCETSIDCTDPLICALGRCHAQCSTSRDCPVGDRCVLSAPGVGVCALPVETQCAAQSDCPAPLTCGPDGQCRSSCASDVACLGEQRCVDSTCADMSELDDAGRLPGAPHDAGSHADAVSEDASDDATDVRDATGADDAADATDATDADTSEAAAPELRATRAGTTSGGGAGASSNYRLSVRVGAPAPMGVGGSAKYRVTIGTRGMR